jgi:hypothetical protein
MKVEDAPITIVSDAGQCAVSILAGGIRIAMSGEEASTLWAQLGDALKAVYRDQPERCPSRLLAFLLHEREVPHRHAATDVETDVDLMLERIVAYAQASGVTADGLAARPKPSGDAALDAQRWSPGALGRAIGKFTGR